MKRFFFLTLICILVNNLGAQNVLTDLSVFKTWTISILGVQTDNYDELTPLQRSLSLSLLPILSAIVKEVDKHYLSTEEKTKARELKREEALTQLSGQLENLFLSEDTAALANETRDIRDKRIANNKQIKEIKKRINIIKNLKNDQIPMDNELPTFYNAQTKYVSISQLTDFQTIASELKSHVLLFYRVYSLSEYNIIEVYQYNAVQRTVLRLLRTAVDPKNITQIYLSLQNSLHSIILGVPAAKLQIAVLTSENQIIYDAQILLDGNVVGFGEFRISAIAAGTHAVSVVHKGEQRNEVIVLEPNDNTLRNYFFEINNLDVITVTSIPSNVRVYVDSQWVGFTPLVIPRPDLVAQLELREPGYNSHRESISPKSSQVLNITLSPTNPIPLEDRFKTDRKKFYNAFSMFAISLALPIILNGFYINEVNASKVASANLSAAGRAEAQTNQNIYFYSYIGASVITGGLAIFTYIRLLKYLKTASEYHDR